MSLDLARIALLAIALHAAGARADDPAAPLFSFRGFGTLGIAHSSDDQADFTSSPAKPYGAGFSHAWSAELDSLIAGQVSARLGPRFSAVLQVVSEQNYEHSYRPHVEWANVKYQVTPDFDVRFGRTVLPGLMLSDSRKVGYSNPWVRPPVEVYGSIPVTSNDGIDAAYRMPMGNATNTFQLTVGRTDSKFPGATSEARQLAVFVDTFEHGPATARLAFGRARITLPALDPLFDGFRQFGPEGAAIADKYAVDNSLVNFFGVGASYDPGRWFLMGEWVGIDGHAILGKKSAWYASGGYRFGKVTPYATYSRAKAEGLSDPGLTLSALPPELAGPATGLNAALNATLQAKVVQSTISLGARWDFRKDTALKLQFDHIRVGAGSSGTFSNLQPGREAGARVDLFSATIDFVF